MQPTILARPAFGTIAPAIVTAPIRRHPLAVLGIAALLAVGPVAVTPAGGVQTVAATDASGEPTSPKSGPREKLRDIQQEMAESDARRRALATDIETFKADRARFAATLIDLAARTTAGEQRIAAGEARLASLQTAETAARQALGAKRAVVAEVLAALQRMGRKPPPALLVEPEDVLKAIRTSMLLGAVLPGMRGEIDDLSKNLEALTRTRDAIGAERQRLGSELASLKAERTRLAALVEARQLALGHAEDEVASERDKAKQLADQAGSLKDLIGRTEHSGGAAARAADAAQQSDQKLAAMMPGAVAPPDPGRLAPAVTFASLRGDLPWPVAGTVMKRFGEDDGLGSSEKGMLFATAAHAVVVMPADGWVAFAGPYRTFGQLLILNVGGGYYIVLAGMDRVNVSLGQFVLAGEPVANMGDGTARTAAALALAVAQPTLYVEFRKDGATIDPGPWWAKPALQKVRG